MKLLRILLIGIPLLVVMIFGGIVAMAADLSGWQWLERFEARVRTWFEELEGAL